MSAPSQKDGPREGDTHDQGPAPVPPLMGPVSMQEEIARQTRILRSAKNGFVAVDLNGVVVSYSGEGVTMWGKRPDEVIGQEYRAVVSNPEEAERRMKLVGSVLQGQIVDDHSDYQSSRRGRVVQDIKGTPIYADDEKTVIGALLEIDDKTREAILDELDRDILKLGEQTTLDGVLDKIGDYASTLAGVWRMVDPEAPKSSIRLVRKIDAATATGDDADAHPSYEVTKLILSGAEESEGGWTRAQTEGMADVEGMAASPVWHWLMHNDRPLIMGREGFQSCVYDEAHPVNIYDPLTNPEGNLVSRRVAGQRGIFSMGAFLLRDEGGEPIGDLRVYNKEDWSDDDVRFLGRLCGKASVAIRNAELYEYSKMMRMALERAVRIQLHAAKNRAATFGGFANSTIRSVEPYTTMGESKTGPTANIRTMQNDLQVAFNPDESPAQAISARIKGLIVALQAEDPIPPMELAGELIGVDEDVERLFTRAMDDASIIGKETEKVVERVRAMAQRAKRNSQIIAQEVKRLEFEATQFSIQIQEGIFEGKLEPIKFGELFQEVGGLYIEHARDKGVDFEVNISPDLPDVLAIREHLTLAMSNLVDNAVKYTPEGGKVEVKAYKRNVGEGIELVQVMVKNTGTLTSEQREDMAAKLQTGEYDKIKEAGGWGAGVADVGKLLIETGAQEIDLLSDSETVSILFSLNVST